MTPLQWERVTWQILNLWGPLQPEDFPFALAWSEAWKRLDAYRK